MRNRPNLTINIDAIEAERKNPAAKDYSDDVSPLVEDSPPPADESPTPASSSCLRSLTKWSTWHTILHAFAIDIAGGMNIVFNFLVSPFIADLMVDFGVVKTKSQAGLFSGIDNALFDLGLMCGALVYPIISNHVGRRATVLICTLFNLTFAVCLMFCTNFWMFIILRGLNGLLSSGLLPLYKVLISESPYVPEKGRPLVFAGYLAGITGGGMVFSLVGGFLGRPYGQYFHNQVGSAESAESGLMWFLRTFPLFGSCAVLAIFNVITLCLTFTFIHETHDELRHDLPPPAKRCFVMPVPDVGGIGPHHHHEVEDVLAEAIDCTIRHDAEHLGCCDRMRQSARDLFHRHTIVVALLYMCVIWGKYATALTVPVLASMDVSDGGLGMKNFEIGYSRSIYMSVGVVIALLNPAIIQRLNLVWICRVLPFVVIPFQVILPELRFLPSHTAIIAVFTVCLGVFNFILAAVFTNIFILQRNVIVGDEQVVFFGITAALGSLAKAIGPWACQTLLAIGARVNVFPLDVHFPLILAAISFAMIGALSFCLPLSLKSPEGAINAIPALSFETLKEEEREGHLAKLHERVPSPPHVHHHPLTPGSPSPTPSEDYDDWLHVWYDELVAERHRLEREQEEGPLFRSPSGFIG